MKRNITKLPDDLRKFFKESEQIAKNKIAKKCLDEAEEKTPAWSGFAKSQGYAYVDGHLVRKSSSGNPNAKRQVSSPPNIDPGHSVTISFHAGRPSTKHGTFFYTFYIGVVNPDHLRSIHHKNWIEASMHPENSSVKTSILQAFAEAMG